MHALAGDRNDESDGKIFACETDLATSADGKAIFAGRFVYHIAARWTGDGCGFCGTFDDAVQCRLELAGFVEKSLKIEADLTLYVAYHDFGESGELPRSFDCLTPSDIRTWKESFDPNEYFELIGS